MQKRKMRRRKSNVRKSRAHLWARSLAVVAAAVVAKRAKEHYKIKIKSSSSCKKYVKMQKSITEEY